jgi:hypothetical protein
VAASLLLTLEGVATALMAWFIFRENFADHPECHARVGSVCQGQASHEKQRTDYSAPGAAVE